jgi:hypothetical protein
MAGPRSHLLDIYDVQLHAATTKRQWNNLRRTHHQIPKLGRVCAYTTFFGDGKRGILVFYLDARMKPDRLVQFAAHEATHGAGLLFDEMAATYNGESEPFAWLVGWLTRWLWEATT